MPTTISSLLVFVALLTPGFVYLTRSETRIPGQRHSALRETASIVSASLVTYGFVLVAFGIARWRWPDLTPDVGAVIKDAETYFEGHYLQVTFWSVALLAAACGLAAVLAVPPRWSERFFARFDFWPARTFAAANQEGAVALSARSQAGGRLFISDQTGRCTWAFV